MDLELCKNIYYYQLLDLPDEDTHLVDLLYDFLQSDCRVSQTIGN